MSVLCTGDAADESDCAILASVFFVGVAPSTLGLMNMVSRFIWLMKSAFWYDSILSTFLASVSLASYSFRSRAEQGMTL